MDSIFLPSKFNEETNKMFNFNKPLVLSFNRNNCSNFFSYCLIALIFIILIAILLYFDNKQK